MTYLASLPGVVEQRDGRRDAPLAVATQRGHADVARILREAGAREEHASFSEHAAGEGGPEPAAYMSWSREARQSYRTGGVAGRGPGRQGRGQAAGRGGDRKTPPPHSNTACPW